MTVSTASRDMGLNVTEWILVLTIVMSLLSARMMWERL